MLKIIMKGEHKVVPVLNEAPRHEQVWEGGDLTPRILNLGTRWR